MLQFETLPASLLVVLAPFQSCFTAPSYRTFVLLTAGMITRPARRTVVGMLIGAGLSRLWHHSRAHWFFACARWDIDAVGVAAAALIVAAFVPADAPIVVAVDDSLFRRSGRKVAGAAWQHDGARQGPRHSQVSYGNCFVVAGIIGGVCGCRSPTGRYACRPVLARLWTPKQTPKTVLACQMLAVLAARFAGRQIHLVADSHYAGADGAQLCAGRRERGLPDGVTLTSRPKANAQFRAIATPLTRPARRPPAQHRPQARRAGRPGRHRHLDQRAGDPLRPHRHRAPGRDPVPVVRRLPLPAHPGHPHPRTRQTRQDRQSPSVDHHRPAQPRDGHHRTLRRPLEHRSRLRRRQNDHRGRRGPATAPHTRSPAPSRSD